MQGQHRGKRKSERVRRRYKAKLNRTLCFTVNIGRDGFCVEILRVLEPGTEVQGTLEAGGVEVPFRGVVSWAHAGAPYLGVRGRMGVRFVEEQQATPDSRRRAQRDATAVDP